MSSFSRIREVLFFLSLGIIVYTYFVYPAILFLGYSLSQLCRDWRYLMERPNRRVAPLKEDQIPTVSVLVPAYNEEAHLFAKIANIQEMDYPQEKLQIIFVSDGSTDRTNEILRNRICSNSESIFLAHRSGKASALNRAVQQARNEILIFSDTSTLFARDAIRKLVRHFADAHVGAVCGALRFQRSAESRQTEGIYWRYESMIRLMEARLGVTMTASGAIYALRRDAYQPLDPGTVLDDFVIPMNARKVGYQVLYDPEAIATDCAPDSVRGEFIRRVRLAVGSFRSLRFVLSVPLGVFGRFAFISHKLLRWILPIFLVTLLVSNLALIGHPFYTLFALLQIFFYLWAGLAFLFRKRIRGARFALIPYFLLAMNVAFLVGLFRSFTSHEQAAWRRVS
jgi:cellulose synthase/poly-beta-1,6-N-acetylglucosamine synthase-like glycosyltransferase